MGKLVLYQFGGARKARAFWVLRWRWEIHVPIPMRLYRALKAKPKARRPGG